MTSVLYWVHTYMKKRFTWCWLTKGVYWRDLRWCKYICWMDFKIGSVIEDIGQLSWSWPCIHISTFWAFGDLLSWAHKGLFCDCKCVIVISSCWIILSVTPTLHFDLHHTYVTLSWLDNVKPKVIIFRLFQGLYQCQCQFSAKTSDTTVGEWRCSAVH